MKSPILNWTCGMGIVLALPLGVIVALSSGSLLTALGSMMIVICVVLLVCRKDIRQEYNQKKRTDKKSQR